MSLLITRSVIAVGKSAFVAALCFLVTLPTLIGAEPRFRLPPLKKSQPVTTTCNELETAWRPVVGRSQDAAIFVPRPPKGQPTFDANFGTCIIRVTEHDVEPPKVFARHDYSRKQAFNSDNTRLLIIAYDGSWHIYDAISLQYLHVLNGVSGDAEPQWHPTNPNLLYYLPRNGVGMKLLEYDIVTNRSRVVGDFAERLKHLWPTASAAWSRSEGTPSADLRYWAFQIDSATWQGLGLFTYDLRDDKILATYDFAKNGKSRPDHVSMSPSGKYVVVSWDEVPHVLTRDLTDARRIASHGEHSDIALDVANDDIYVSVDYQKRGGPVFMVNLRTGQRTDLFDSYVGSTATAMHFSGKSYGMPGWVIVSTYGEYDSGNKIKRFWGGSGHKWLHGKIMAIELRADPRIVNLAYHHSTYAEYWTEPQASVNRDLTRILFNSNWGTSSKLDVDTYMVVIPKKSLPHVR